MTSLTFLTVVAVDPITRTKKEVLVNRTPLTNEWTDRCVRSGHLAVTLHSQSSRKKRRDWSWKCKHRLKWRISIIVMEFFGNPIVPDGKISGTARSSYGTAGYIRKWLVAWTVPSHYLKQCWIIVNWTLRNKLQWNRNRNSKFFIQENALEHVVCEMASILSRPQWVKSETLHS